MGGGDYPIVVSDLSVARASGHPRAVVPGAAADAGCRLHGADEDFWGRSERAGKPPLAARRTVICRLAERPDVDDSSRPLGGFALQVIPDRQLRTLTQQPPSDGDDDFWSGRDRAEKAPRPGGAAGPPTSSRPCSSRSSRWSSASSRSAGRQVKTKRIAYTFPVEAFPQTGVTVSRTWTLYGGQHPSLHGDLTFYSSRSDQVTVEELLPKSLVTQASKVTFIPKPKIVSEDPVVASYSISSALDGVTSAEYTIPLPGGEPVHARRAAQVGGGAVRRVRPALPALAHAREHPPDAGEHRRQEGRRGLPARDQRPAAGRHRRSDHRVRYGQVVGRQPEDRQGQQQGSGDRSAAGQDHRAGGGRQALGDGDGRRLRGGERQGDAAAEAAASRARCSPHARRRSRRRSACSRTGVDRQPGRPSRRSRRTSRRLAAPSRRCTPPPPPAAGRVHRRAPARHPSEATVSATSRAPRVAVSWGRRRHARRMWLARSPAYSVSADSTGLARVQRHGPAGGSSAAFTAFAAGTDSFSVVAGYGARQQRRVGVRPRSNGCRAAAASAAGRVTRRRRTSRPS